MIPEAPRTLLPIRAANALLEAPRRSAVEAELRTPVSELIDSVRRGGETTLRNLAERFDGLPPNATLAFDASMLHRAADSIPTEARELLERVADRIRRFAQAQRGAIAPLVATISGARVGHMVEPVGCAGCYAPGGRHPLPSSVLMTAVTARSAGVERVIVASPSRDPVMLAAAAIAGADRYLNVGGAHAIAALAFGVATPTCDVIVGPGNRWVTEAKRQLVGRVGIDMLAGPSELLIIADESASATTIAADLLAQAEHDTDAVAWLVTTDPTLVDRVDEQLRMQLAGLPRGSRDVATIALANGGCTVCDSLTEAIALSDAIAPEHLQVLTADADAVARRIRNAGGIFIGERTAQVFGDYGIGPNHTLPTGGCARFSAGLSVIHFLRLRTFVRFDASSGDETIIDDTIALARLEGLEAHARAAQRRRTIGAGCSAATSSDPSW